MNLDEIAHIEDEIQQWIDKNIPKDRMDLANEYFDEVKENLENIGRLKKEAEN